VLAILRRLDAANKLSTDQKAWLPAVEAAIRSAQE
jgi:hypothetical protein